MSKPSSASSGPAPALLAPPVPQLSKLVTVNGKVWKLTYTKDDGLPGSLTEAQWTMLVKPTMAGISAAMPGTNSVDLSADAITYNYTDETGSHNKTITKNEYAALSPQARAQYPNLQPLFSRHAFSRTDGPAGTLPLSRCFEMLAYADQVIVPEPNVFYTPTPATPAAAPNPRAQNQAQDLTNEAILKALENVGLLSGEPFFDEDDLKTNPDKKDSQWIIVKKEGENLVIHKIELNGDTSLNLNKAIFLFKDDMENYFEFNKDAIAENIYRCNPGTIYDVPLGFNGRTVDVNNVSDNGKKFRQMQAITDVPYLINADNLGRCGPAAIAYMQMHRDGQCGDDASCTNTGYAAFMKGKAQILCDEAANYMIVPANKQLLAQDPVFRKLLQVAFLDAEKEELKRLFPLALNEIDHFCNNPEADENRTKEMIKLYAHYIRQEGTNVDGPFFYVVSRIGGGGAQPIAIVRKDNDTGNYLLHATFPEGQRLDPTKTLFISYDGKGHYRAIDLEKLNSMKEPPIKLSNLCERHNKELTPDGQALKKQEDATKIQDLIFRLHTIAQSSWPRRMWSVSSIIKSLQETEPRAVLALKELAGSDDLVGFLKNKTPTELTQIQSRVATLIEISRAKNGGTTLELSPRNAYDAFCALSAPIDKEKLETYLTYLSKEDLEFLNIRMGLNLPPETDNRAKAAVIAPIIKTWEGNFSDFVTALKNKRQLTDFQKLLRKSNTTPQALHNAYNALYIENMLSIDTALKAIDASIQSLIPTEDEIEAALMTDPAGKAAILAL